VRWVFCAPRDGRSGGCGSWKLSAEQASGKRGKRFLHLNQTLLEFGACIRAGLAAEQCARTKEFQTDKGIEEYR
jgi:hypothetical protein